MEFMAGLFPKEYETFPACFLGMAGCSRFNAVGDGPKRSARGHASFQPPHRAAIQPIELQCRDVSWVGKGSWRFPVDAFWC